MTPICWLFLRRAYWLPISLHRLNTTILLCMTRCIQGVKKYSNRRTKLLSPTTSTFYRIDESIPKAQMGYVFPSTSSNARVTHSRNPPQHYPKQHPTDCFDTLKYIQSMMKSETWHPQNSPLLNLSPMQHLRKTCAAEGKGSQGWTDSALRTMTIIRNKDSSCLPQRRVRSSCAWLMHH